MKLYIAGPMTGYPFFNFPAFFAAAASLKRRGYEVLNPAQKEAKDGTDKPDRAKVPVAWGGTNTEKTPGDIRQYDFHLIDAADGIVLMRGWERSKGALAEALYAQTIGRDIYLMRSDGSLTELHPRWVFSVVINWRHAAGPNLSWEPGHTLAEDVTFAPE